MTDVLRMFSIPAIAVWAMLALHAPAQAQYWPNLDQVMFPHLTRTGTAEASFFLPDNADPALAQRGVGIVYEYIEGSAGSTSIAVGLFVKQGAAWAFAGTADGLFGQSPRDAAFTATTVELTTTMPGPNDPRCCPTQPTRWRIDLATRGVQRLN